MNKYRELRKIQASEKDKTAPLFAARVSSDGTKLLSGRERMMQWNTSSGPV